MLGKKGKGNFVNLIVAGHDIKNEEFALVLWHHLRTDLAPIDCSANPTDFLVRK